MISPKITNGKIELFGPKGKEIYTVSSIFFHYCKTSEYQDCMHDVSMEYKDFFGNIFYFQMDQIPFQELVENNYIQFFSGQQQKTYQKNAIYHPNCKLLTLPQI